MYLDSEICKVARKYRRRCDCNDPYRLASDLGIIVMYEDLGDPSGNKAMTYCNSRIFIIILNYNLPEVVQAFILYHEIGHYALHKDYFKKPHIEKDVYGNQQKETEANKFAAEMILDDDEILEEIQESGYTFYQIASLHKVPFEILAYKFMLLEEKGYDIPPIPEYPSSDFLTGDLGMDENWNDHYCD